MVIDLNEQRQAVVLDSLQSLGTTPNLTDDQIDNISRFVIQMYCSKRQDCGRQGYRLSTVGILLKIPG